MADEALTALRTEVAALRAELGSLRAEVRTAVADELRGFDKRNRKDIRAAGERVAAEETAALVRERLAGAAQLDSPQETLEHALRVAPADGMALEFGVYTGTTLRVIAEHRGGRDVYGFDSFEGFPEHWRSGFPRGRFAVADIPSVPGATIVPGWFADTLPGFLADHEGPVDFVHVDCCLASATTTVLDAVGPRLHPGAVILFDEYFNYPGWQDHEYRAWQEYVRRTGTPYRYVGYTQAHEQVIVQVQP